jgi:hypothetical protein
MARRKVDAQKSTVSLHAAPSFASAWEAVILPWFEAVALKAIESNEPAAVITPYPIAGAFLRSKLLEHGVSLIGVKFLTAPLLRELLLADAATTAVPLREHLRLLLAIVSESSATENGDNVDLSAIAKSIARSPDNLLRAFDQLGAAGWSFEDAGPAAIREITRSFQELVKECGFKLVHEADRAALEASGRTAKKFSAVLLTGFTAAHWPLLPLLQSAVLSARRANVVLEYPRDSSRSADESWIGTWEENFGAIQSIPEEIERARPFSDLIRSEQSTAHSNGRIQPQFLVGLNATEQANAICALTLKFLAEQSCTRLGILFPRGCSLSRLVSEALARASVPHCDAIGHFLPGEFEQPQWNNWIHLQENHQLDPLLRFLEANPESFGKLSIHEVRGALQRVYGTILIDDLGVLREACARQTDRPLLIQIAKLLGSIRFFPAKATFEQFIAETKSIFHGLKWNNRWDAVDQFSRKWRISPSMEFSRTIYLRWLKETLDSFSMTRAPKASHIYSRVQLLTYSEAETQEWSHLILAGLNQGEWPEAEHESGFLPDNEIAELNKRATRAGGQGEGHVILSKGKTLLLSSQHARQFAIRQFAAAVESAEHGLAITASLLQESAPERIWNPSEQFSQLYFATHRTPLSQETSSILRAQTFSWLKNQAAVAPAASSNGEISQTRLAYDSRRNAEVPFGEFEFALREPIDRQVILRATEWDKVVKTPALIWMKTYLGLENQEQDLNQWHAATGTWVHDWLATIAASQNENAFVAFPNPTEIQKRIAAAANAFRQSIVDLCDATGRQLPDWWNSGWSNAFALADFLASKMAEAQGWPQLAAEWKLKSQELTLADGKKLRVRGRIDLILAQSRLPDANLANGNLWIIDYKTGNAKPLNVSGKTPEARVANLRKKLVRGDAIQLGFYGLAARELGAREVQLSILSLRTDLDKPQLVLEDLASHTDFWNELHRMQEKGVFGLRGAIRNDFGFHADYPLAILPIDKEFLDEKWVLTHPAFADDEDERS